jgi:hypothetical protein
MMLGFGIVCAAQSARAGEPGQDTAAVGLAIPAASVAALKSTGRDEEDAEDAAMEIDPLLRLQMLSLILITVEGTPTGVTLTPGGTSSGGGGGGDGGGGDGHTSGGPSAPEPASLVLGLVGAGMAFVANRLRRRRRQIALAA